MDKCETCRWVRDLFDYRDDGALVYRISRPQRKAGTTFGAITHEGYIQGKCSGTNYKAHRLVWAWHHGQFPEGKMIDHINGVRSDNRIENLRLADNGQNQCNSGPQINTKSGIRGVSRSKNAWQAAIYRDKKRHYLGTYARLEDAIAKVNEARLMLHGEFASLHQPHTPKDRP